MKRYLLCLVTIISENDIALAKNVYFFCDRFYVLVHIWKY